jgi:glycine/D-amino acid oxidase-like deaminating enzyme
MRASRPPRDDDDCGWWNVLPSPPPPRRLAADVAADCVVVGAGFTGLAIAHQLALHRPDWQIAVVEGQRAGYGASGRNSGFAGAITHLDPTRGIEEALRLGRLCRTGIDALRSVVRDRGIACDWTECGRIHAAADDHALRSLEGLLRILEAAGEAHQALDRRALAVALGTDHYRAGVHIASTVLLQPAALARGLAGALPENVTLYEESPVRRIQREDRWRVDAGNGAVRSDRVFLALNGYAPALRVLRRRVFPLLTFASWTRPLAPGELAQVGDREQWGLVSEDRMGTTLRRTRDGRILVRSVVRYAPSLRVAERTLASRAGALRLAGIQRNRSGDGNRLGHAPRRLRRGCRLRAPLRHARSASAGVASTAALPRLGCAVYGHLPPPAGRRGSLALGQARLGAPQLASRSFPRLSSSSGSLPPKMMCPRGRCGWIQSLSALSSSVMNCDRTALRELVNGV